jgi:hypothetical protein
MSDESFSRYPRPRTLEQQLKRRHGPSSNQRFEPLPPPTGPYPFRFALADVLPAEELQAIEAAGRMRFHCVGDTGGIKDPHPQEEVAARMVSDLHADDPPRFFYHLGDVVYFFGAAEEYYSQFYEPYEHYTAPILAIPGNHDGNLPPHPAVPSLAAFVSNFCAPTAHRTVDAQDAQRAAMTQPNVYWTLLAPWLTIVGLYTNVPNGGQLADDQVRWLAHELQSAPAEGTLVLALHHPVYSGDVQHGSNLALGDVLDGAFEHAGRVPDAVFAGHVHNYQRFVRRHYGKQIPYVVAGAGGYHNLHKVPAPDALPVTHPEDPHVQLVTYQDTDWGYLLAEASPSGLAVEYRTAGGTGAPFDAFTIPAGSP